MVFLVDIRLHEDLQRFVARQFSDVVCLLQDQVKGTDLEYLKIEAVPELPQEIPA
jgi:hypothetical protein